jgi:hypothetical protein
MEPTGIAPVPGAAPRLLRRFASSYFVLYLLPFPLGALAQILALPGVLAADPPGWIPTRFVEWIAAKCAIATEALGEAAAAYAGGADAVAKWVGKNVFDVELARFPTGSGDTTFDWVQLCCTAAAAMVVTTAWTLIARRRPIGAPLRDWIRAFVRFGLATILVSYGAYKVIPTQFTRPSLDRLLQPFGDASPMGLLWTFMGASPAFCIVTGAAEMLAGLLLVPRKTALLGALASIGVMSVIVAMNFCYDVPVKLYSAHLLAMAAFVAAHDGRRLAGFFVLERPVAASEPRMLWRPAWLDRGARIVAALFALAWVACTLQQSASVRASYGATVADESLRGIWDVEEFELEGERLPPLVTEERRWRRVVFGSAQMLGLQGMDGSRQRFRMTLDPAARRLTLSKWDDPDWSSALEYSVSEPGGLVITGSFDGRATRATCKRAPDSEFLLVSRGFHWISEYPFNR